MIVCAPKRNPFLKTSQSSSGLHRCAALLVSCISFATPAAQAQDVPGPPKPGSQPAAVDGRAPLNGPPVRDQSPRKPPSDPELTLDQAVDRFLKENLELRTLRDEVLMAQADVEAAGQPPQAWLWIKVGTEGIQMRQIQPREPSLYRWLRIWDARAAKLVTEAQYQDAARTRLDNLYTAYVDVQAEQMRVRLTEVALRGIEGVLKVAQALQRAGQDSRQYAANVQTECDSTKSALGDAEAALRKANLVLANLLNLSDADAEKLRVSGLDSAASARAAPPVEELIRRALTHRADVRAYRLGLQRAQLEWLKALIEPLNQITMRAGPSDLGLLRPRQDGNAPVGSLEAVITLPTTVRNRGILKRATINVQQTRTELANVECQVVLNVRTARLEYEQARSVVDRSRQETIPREKGRRDALLKAFQGAEVDVKDYLEAQAKYDKLVQQYLHELIRLRRSMLALNTAVGERVMP
jgi:cobalt-zinc-cadmium efflux system outer membrane protein